VTNQLLHTIPRPRSHKKGVEAEGGRTDVRVWGVRGAGGRRVDAMLVRDSCELAAPPHD
jgi:hypothetical protein